MKPRPRWMEDNRDKARRSRKQEDRWAKTLGGKRVARSGAIRQSRWSKRTAGGDVRAPELYMENKRTDCASISVKREWLERIAEEASMRSKTPALGITFDGRVRMERDWVMLPLTEFTRMIEALREKA